jgi:competence protein ComEC
MLTIWLTDWGKRHYKTLGISIFSLFIGFLMITQLATTKVTILSAKNQPTIVAQFAGKTIVFDGEINAASQFELVLLLRQSGVNQIESLIAFKASQESTSQDLLDQEFKTKHKIILPNDVNAEKLQSLGLFNIQRFGDMTIQLRQEKPFLLEIKIKRQPFYILGDRQPGDAPLIALDKGYLITNPKNIDLELWQTLKPQGAIAIGSPQGHFLAPNSIVHWTEQDGDLEWTPRSGLAPIAPEPL